MHKFADMAAKLVLNLKKGWGGERKLALHNFHVAQLLSD